MDYKYLWDKLTDPKLKGAQCSAVLRENGKCIRSRMGTMLVVFENGEKCIVIARLLRKNKS